MPVAIYMQKSTKGQKRYLVKNEDAEKLIGYFNKIQNFLNGFHNIETQPYTGRKWRNDLFVWVVEG
jgi:hypothetical protein